MNYFIKNTFLSAFLVSILIMVLTTNIPDFFLGVLFFVASFFISLSASAQSFTLARLPFLFIFGWFLFFSLTPPEIISDNFIITIAISFFALLSLNGYFSSLFRKLPNIAQEEKNEFIKKYDFARNIVLVFLLLAVLLWYSIAFIIYSVWGKPFYITLLLIFLVTFLLTSYVLKIYSMSDATELKKEFLLYAWVIGLVVAELGWIAGFWPFGYLTAAFIITIIYYAIVSILKEYLFGSLRKRDLISNIVFSILVIIIIFNYTNWLPL